MNKKKRLKILIPASLALMLAAGTRVQDALAYFTSYTAATGRLPVSLSHIDTETGDEVRDWTKHISVINTGGVPCFVRVKVLVGGEYMKYVSYSSQREGSWTLKEDGYWYYDTVLNPGEATDELLAALDRVMLNQDTENGEEQEFNVIVVQEHTVALYDRKGNPYADWTMAEKSAQPAAQAEDNTGTAGSAEDGDNAGAAGGTEAENSTGTAGRAETQGNTGEGVS